MNFDFEDSYGKLIDLSQGDDKVFIQPDGTKIKASQIPPEPQVTEITEPSPAFGQPGQSLFGVTTRTADIRPEAAAPPELKEVSYGDILKATSQVVAGMPPGVIAGVAGTPADLAGLIYGGFQAATAEEGQRLESFMEGLDNPLTQALGSEQFLGIIGDVVDFLPISEDAKSFVKGGAEAGSFLGLPATVTAAIASGAKGMKGAKQAADTASAVTLVDEAVDALAPIIIENPEAGPLDRSQLPPRVERPEAKPSEIDELGFVLKSLEVAKNLQQKRGTAQQFLKRLEQNGVSAEEIDALGLREKFSDPNEQITRDQFVQTIRDRRIELEESTKGSDLVDGDEFDLSDITFGEGTPDRDSMNWQGRAEDYMYEIKEGDEYAIDSVLGRLKQNYPDDYSDEQIESIKQSLLLKEMDQLDARDRSNIDDAAYDVAEDEYMQDPYMEYRANETDNYTIYGNDEIGYQVLRYGSERVNDREVYSLSEAQVIARQDAYEQGDLAGVESVTEARFENFMLPGGENYREILLRDPGTPTGGSKSHWSEDDVIGHVLVKDRVDAQGNKTLYAEEVQSDFAQSARPSSAEKTRMEMAKSRVAAAQRDVEFANEQIEQMRSQIRSIEESMAGMSAIEKTEAFKKIEAINKEIAPMERRAESSKRDIDYFQDTIAETETNIANRAEKVGKTRFVKDTQQWLRPTLKRLIAKAIEEGYDTVSVPPFQVVHERWNEDYGDFYRKSVPNTLLKIAKQLDPNAKLEYSDLVGSAYPELRGAAADRGVSAGTNGLDRTPTIKITPAMREAYQEKGQSLFVPGAATIVAGKLVVDKVTKEQEDDRAKATR